MWQRFVSFLGTVAAFAVVGVGIWAVIKGIDEDPSVVGSFATALVGVIAILIQRDRENKRELQQVYREHLAPIYEDLLARMNQGLDFSKPEEQEWLQGLQRKLLFYGSDGVVAAWLNWLRSIPGDNDPDEDEKSARALLNWEKLLFAIRKDAGHSNSGLATGDLLRIYIYDADDHLRASLPSLGDGSN